MKIIPATPQDADALTQLTFRSKAHWGYTSEQMEQWREDLTISPDYIEKHTVYLIQSGNQVKGYFSLCQISSKEVELDNLFIDPEFMGLGLGKALLRDCLKKIQSLGYNKVILYADPNAEKFYEKHGFKTVDQLPSAVPNRFLPMMELQLQPESKALR